MTGFREGHLAVEFYRGDWILRAALPGDRPLTDSPAASRAYAAWLERGRARFVR